MLFCIATLVIINCTHPRLEFTDYYQQACNSPYPGLPGEPVDVTKERMKEGAAAYVGYIESYRDQCPTH